MEIEDKLYKRIQKAAESSEQNSFSGMEKVWTNVEDKLEKKSLQTEKNNWKKISIAASVIIMSTIIYHFYNNSNQSKIQLEEHNIVITDSIKEQQIINEQITNFIKDTVKKNPLINLKKEEIVFTSSPKIISQKDSILFNKNIVTKQKQLGFLNFNDTVIANQNTKRTKESSDIVLQKGNKKPQYFDFPTTQNSFIQSPKTTLKKPDPLVIINGKVENLDKMKQMKDENLDSIYILHKPLYIINSIEYSEESLFGKNPTSPYYPLDKQNITATTIYKKEEAQKIYGDKGKDGVVIISTKTIKVDSKKLVLINDMVVNQKILNKIDVNQIESIKNVTPENALKNYGEKGKNGAIFIRMKKLTDKEHRKLIKLIAKYN